MSNETVIFIRHVPKKTRDKFKAWCAEAGFSMQEMVSKMLEEAVKDTPPAYVARSVDLLFKEKNNDH